MRRHSTLGSPHPESRDNTSPLGVHRVSSPVETARPHAGGPCDTGR